MPRAASLAVLVALALPGVVRAATVTETRDIAMDDGATLRATVFRPSGPERVPAVVAAGPYGVGEAASPQDIQGGPPPGLVEDGFAVVDVSVRGTGCSRGSWDPFSAREAQDVAAVVRWAARQPWSTGRVGMAGGSYLGTTQLFAAAQHPEGLAAIAPVTPIVDAYRDVARPGGVLDAHVPVLFAGVPAASEKRASELADAGDAVCRAAVDDRLRGGASGWFTTVPLTTPLDGAGYRARSAIEVASRVEVPTLTAVALQDVYVRTGAAALPARLGGPSQLIVLNGLHDTPERVPLVQARIRAWLARWLKPQAAPAAAASSRGTSAHRRHGRPRRASRRASTRRPRATPQQATTTVLYEVEASDLRARFTRELGAWPPPAQRRVLALAGSGSLLLLPGGGGNQVTLRTAPLGAPTLLTGEASLSLGITASSRDADLFATLSEVRPDGAVVRLTWAPQRLALRGVDPARSRPGAPYHPFTTPQDMPASGLERVPIAFGPVAHLVRPGSRLQVTLSAPPIRDVLNEPSFLPSTLAGTVTVDGGASTLDLPVLDGAPANLGAPACGSLVGESC